MESLFGHYLKYGEVYQLIYNRGLSYLVLDTIKKYVVRNQNKRMYKLIQVRGLLTDYLVGLMNGLQEECKNLQQ